MGQLSGRGLPSRLGKPTPRLREATTSTADDGRRSKDWLNTSRWQKTRARVLARDRWICQQTGVLLVGKYPAPNSPVVDHKVPHRGNEALFWDEGNLQAVSKEWHDRVKQSIEKSGQV